MRYFFTAITSLFIFLFLFAGAESNLDPAWEKYASAQKKVQVAMHHLLGLRAEKLKGILDITRELQLAEIDLKSMQFYYLRANLPSRIITNQDIKAYSSFAWDETDSLALRKQDKKYKKLEDKIAKLKNQQSKSADWPLVRDVLDNLTAKQDPAYLEIMVRFQQSVKEVEEMLGFKAPEKLNE